MNTNTLKPYALRSLHLYCAKKWWKNATKTPRAQVPNHHALRCRIHGLTLGRIHSSVAALQHAGDQILRDKGLSGMNSLLSGKPVVGLAMRPLNPLPNIDLTAIHENWMPSEIIIGSLPVGVGVRGSLRLERRHSPEERPVWATSTSLPSKPLQTKKNWWCLVVPTGGKWRDSLSWSLFGLEDPNNLLIISLEKEVRVWEIFLIPSFTVTFPQKKLAGGLCFWVGNFWSVVGCVFYTQLNIRYVFHIAYSKRVFNWGMYAFSSEKDPGRDTRTVRGGPTASLVAIRVKTRTGSVFHHSRDSSPKKKIHM